MREKLWRSFHQIRVKKLKDIWSKYYSTVNRERFDPLIEQQVNVKLFEGVLHTHFEVSQPAGIAISTSLKPQELSEDEEQIVRYVAGYVSRSLLTKHEKESSEKAVEFVECLSNRLFREIEMKMQKKLLSVLESSLSLPGKRELIVDAVTADDDVQFLWVLVSCDITDEDNAVFLLKEIIGLWLTIRGFSITGTWLEKYKEKIASTRKSKGLRKNLKQSITQPLTQED